MSAIIAVSHSALQCFDTCPRQYEARYVTKECPFVQSAEAKWGDDVHNALERSGRDGVPLPPNMAQYAPHLQALMRRPGDKVFEGNVALDIDGKPCSYFAKTPDKQNLVWMRGKIDVVNLRRDLGRAEVFDWKTGKVKNDPSQLVLYALFVFKHHPEVEEVRAGYSWIAEPVERAFTAPVNFYRRQEQAIERQYRDKYDTIQHATEVGKFPPRPSGLCNGWCPVTSCEYHREGKRK